MNNQRIVFTDADLENCIMFLTPVEVWMHGELEEPFGFVEQYSDDVVKINGIYYMRPICEIRMKRTPL